MWQLSMQTDDDALREIGDGDHRQPRRRRLPGGVGGRDRGDGHLARRGRSSGRSRLVQSFDPIGVAARDLQECLWLQLRHLGLEGTPTEKIVTEHLRLLQNHQVPELARKLGLTIDELKQHIEIIRHLDPKPGSRYNPPQSQYVMPDVYVVKVEDQYVVAAERGRAAAAAHQPGLPAPARQGEPTTATRRAPT